MSLDALRGCVVTGVVLHAWTIGPLARPDAAGAPTSITRVAR